MLEATGFLIALVLAICWGLEARGASRLAKHYAERVRKERERCEIDVIAAHARGWEEGRLYEYRRREPKRGQGGRYTYKKQDAETAQLLEP